MALYRLFIAAYRPVAGLLNRRQQAVQVACARIAHAVDEEGRGSADAAPDAARNILPHLPRVRVLAQLALEAFQVKAQPPRVAVQVIIVEGGVALAQQVMHLPEAPLRAGGFRRLRG